MAKNKKRKKTPGQSQPDNAPKGNHPKPSMSLYVGIATAFAVTGWLIFSSGQQDVRIDVTLPQLSEKAVRGQVAFKATCAKCHGEDAGGTSNGPPLVDPFYRPGHHGDSALRTAITFGVRQHHWKFGPMPPQATVKAAEIPAIIAFIREVQRANGVN